MTNWTARLAVISGGLSEESSTHRLAQLLCDAVVESAREQGGEVVAQRIDLRALAHDITTASSTRFAPPALADAYEVLGAADAVVAVTPTYKASFTGLFKSFWDATADGVLSGVPVIVGATGGSTRHSLVTDTALRPLFAYMKALVMPTAVYASPDEWAGRGLEARASEAADELTQQLERGLGGADVAVNGSSEARSSKVEEAPRTSSKSFRTLADTRNRARDPFVAVPTMEEMLRG
ncbi:CE1759 family FMN reductase [Dermacoccus abyssi]|uniref:CE1759 family FMN reductase n=1 Tax=Dermacoccus abyssi TaxID=322596 RepID=UPI002AD21007|nr:CE1759 family FMN reductase [Dermacoccus abyssi]